MKRVHHISVAFALAAAIGLSAPTAFATPAPQCLTWRTEARYRNYGYDHLVHIHNGCEQRVSCRVSTNANPTEIRVSVSAGADVTVVTFVGSPSREFSATVQCVLEGG